MAGTLLGCVHHELPGHIAPLRRVPPPPIEDELRLVIFGDWGCGKVEQWEVAQGVNAAARELGGFHAGIFLGDNFYPAGVDSTGDPLWREYFEEVYDTEYLGALTWHAVLGNHDHAGNPQAQIDYSKRSHGRWSMPWYFYRHDFGPPGSEPLLTMLGIDTDRKLEYQAEQVRFLRAEFEKLKDARWPVIVCGHHPFVSNGNHEISSETRRLIEPVLNEARPMAYFCGHDHNLQMIQRPEMLHVIAGGGGKTLHTIDGHTQGTLYKKMRFGFAVLDVSRDRTEIQFRGKSGDVLFRHEVESLVH